MPIQALGLSGNTFHKIYAAVTNLEFPHVRSGDLGNQVHFLEEQSFFGGIVCSNDIDQWAEHWLALYYFYDTFAKYGRDVFAKK